MELKTELETTSQKILIVDKKNSLLCHSLKNHLKKFDNSVFLSPRQIKNLDSFNMVFLIDEKINLQKIISYSNIKTVFIFFNRKKEAEKLFNFIIKQSLKKLKIINIEGETNLSLDNFNNFLWFVFSHSDEQLLNIFQLKKNYYTQKSIENKRPFLDNLPKIISGIKISKILVSLFILFVVYHLLFLPFLIASSYYQYQAVRLLRLSQKKQSQSYLTKGSNLLTISKNLYQQPQYLLRLFSLAAPFDNLFSVNEKIASFLNHSDIVYQNLSQMISLFFKKDKTPEEKNVFSGNLISLKSGLDNLSEDMGFLNQKIPAFLSNQQKLKEDISQANELIKKTTKLLPQMEELLGKNSTKKYLLLFANNMEIRPGGGFIGSFGVLTIKDFTLEDLKIYDVYDADGQLTGHVDPPAAIRKYLDQPHWFLRDSAFSGDFTENYKAALFFLKKEMNLNDFNGAILLTTSAIQNILRGYEKFYLPDYNEMITADNFYIKAQVYSEKSFFPGSTQKKSFLGAIARYLLSNLEGASYMQIGKGIKKSLDEKQMVVYFDDIKSQDLIDSFYWSGKIIYPQCPQNLNNCFADYIFPLDANLGVNKANFYINRMMEVNISFDKDGYLHNKIMLRYKNESPKTVFPGGPYKNYFQLLFPVDTVIKQVTKNDVFVEDLDQSVDQLKKIGFLFTLLPQSTADIKVEYQSTTKLEKGRSYYQLLIQKQIGYGNNDMILHINLPKNIHLINQNFSPLVKDSQILYNSQLSTDKVFFLELLKE